ncbi:Gp49 family protein [Halopseudomonas sp.]|uniref:Gp49 family protein n=1 Tax=Halopseudomonas sp. TaxID=2901191 RepID=UPI00311FF03E
MSDKEIEQEIQDKGLSAPRITPADIEANIIAEACFTAYDGMLGAYKTHNDVHQGKGEIHHQSLGLLTICVLVLRNGFTVTGESACASPENFDEELGRKIARQNAVQKIWPLMGYELRSKLAVQSTLGCSNG